MLPVWMRSLLLFLLAVKIHLCNNRLEVTPGRAAR